MNKFIDFFMDNPCGYMATCDNNIPHVRPWSFLFVEDEKIWFLTTSNKRIYKQLQANPRAEFCSISSEMIHGRIGGNVVFEDNMTVKRKVFEVRPMLKDIYESAENPILVSFYIEHGFASMYSSRLKVSEYIEF